MSQVLGTSGGQKQSMTVQHNTANETKKTMVWSELCCGPMAGSVTTTGYYGNYVFPPQTFRWIPGSTPPSQVRTGYVADGCLRVPAPARRGPRLLLSGCLRMIVYAVWKGARHGDQGCTTGDGNIDCCCMHKIPGKQGEHLIAILIIRNLPKPLKQISRKPIIFLEDALGPQN